MNEYIENGYLVREYEDGRVERILQNAAPDVSGRPVMLITGITGTDSTMVSPGNDDVTCPVGSVLTVTAELRGPEDQVLPVTESFRMPIRRRDGREEFLLAAMTVGRVEISAPMDESGLWSVTEEFINESLPEASRMRFAGLRIFVVK